MIYGFGASASAPVLFEVLKEIILWPAAKVLAAVAQGGVDGAQVVATVMAEAAAEDVVADQLPKLLMKMKAATGDIAVIATRRSRQRCSTPGKASARLALISAVLLPDMSTPRRRRTRRS